MKRSKLYITILSILISIAATAQVQTDQPILLTGSGVNANFTGIKNSSGSTDAISVEALQNGGLTYGAATGTNNAFSINLNPAITSYQAGSVFYFLSNQTVSGPATLSINGLTAKPIVKYASQPLSGCEIFNGQIVKVIYDGTNFQISSLMPPVQAVTAPVAIAASGVTTSQIVANWNTTTGATGYFLDVATDAAFTSMLTGYNNRSVGNVTSFSVTSGISCGNTYYYRVRATNICGTSINSNTISILVHNPTYVAITLTNSAGTATGVNFQQMVTVNSSTYSAYETTGLQNVEFTVGGPDGSGTILQAWLESGNTTASTNTIYWVNLGSNSIPANGTLTIYMNFMAGNIMSNAGPTGEAPQLSGTYGQYDNGSIVFTFYDNFAGTTLNTTKWTNFQSSCYTINNGLTYVICSNTDFLQSTSTFNSIVIDQYLKPTNGGWVGFAVPGTYSGHVGVLFYNQLGWSMLGTSQISDSHSLPQNTFYVITGAVSGGVSKLDINYVNDLTSGAGYYNNTTSFLELANGNQGTGFVQWMRARNYPPSYTMPGVAFGVVVPSVC